MTEAKPQRDVHAQIDQILSEPDPLLPEELVRGYVSAFVDRRPEFLSLVQRHGSPLYVFDERALRSRVQQFHRVFEGEFPRLGCYYAVKSNNHPWVAGTVVNEGWGLDVSSGIELEAALEAGAADIVFSGPGKTAAELTLAVENADRVTVLIDSLGESRRLAEIARASQTTIRAGVRVTPPVGQWQKFGVPLDRLRPFWEEAGRCGFVDLCGLQFHTSWNLDPSRQIKTLGAIDREVRTWPERLRDQIAFLDIGGGFWPPQGEWMLEAATRRGKLLEVLDGVPPHGEQRHLAPAQPIELFARRLAQTLRGSVFDTFACRVCVEPGRWVSNEAMHLLVTVVDKKEEDLVIVDAGTNAIGWERFESDYAPLVNLSRPALFEQRCRVLGSLCTPHDVWGSAYWGADLEAGDVLLVPDQGAYTYSLRQQFIKGVPPVVPLDAPSDQPGAQAFAGVATEG